MKDASGVLMSSSTAAEQTVETESLPQGVPASLVQKLFRLPLSLLGTSTASGTGRGVAVGVGVGLWVSVGVSVGVAVGVAVAVAVGEAVSVGVSVGVAVGDAVGVSVGVSIGVAVGVAVAVAVSDAVGDAVDVGASPLTLISSVPASPEYPPACTQYVPLSAENCAWDVNPWSKSSLHVIWTRSASVVTV